jgi:hypothetical protein
MVSIALSVSFSTGRLSTDEILLDAAGSRSRCFVVLLFLTCSMNESKSILRYFFSLFEQQPNFEKSAECCGLRLVSACSTVRRLVPECVTKLIFIPWLSRLGARTLCHMRRVNGMK